jgi:hypothetical protein
MVRGDFVLFAKFQTILPPTKVSSTLTFLIFSGSIEKMSSLSGTMSPSFPGVMDLNGVELAGDTLTILRQKHQMHLQVALRARAASVAVIS